jgi:hypothetical protein
MLTNRPDITKELIQKIILPLILAGVIAVVSLLWNGNKQSAVVSTQIEFLNKNLKDFMTEQRTQNKAQNAMDRSQNDRIIGLETNQRRNTDDIKELKKRVK